MAIKPIIQPSFAGGEITEALESRDDLAKQKVGLLTCRNAILTSTGAWKNRGGLKFIAAMAAGVPHRLMSFVFSQEQAYLLIWGELAVWFVKDGVMIENPPGTPVFIVTPYAAASLSDLYESQSADVMSIAHPTIKPHNLTRSSDIAWTISAIDFQDGPYVAFKDGDEDITVTPSAKTGAGVTLTASSALWTTVGVGDHIRLGFVNPLDISILEWAWCKVTAVASSTSITVTTEVDFGFEYLLNPDFKDGIGFWQNHSSPLGDATVEHVAASQELRFISTATPHDAVIRNNIAVSAHEDLILELIVTQVTTSFRVFVGTTSGAADILGAQVVNSTGTKTWTVRPTQSSIWLTIDTTGQPAGTHKISNASLKRKDLATQHHRQGAWNSDRGYPQTVTRLEQRTFWGGNRFDEPDTIWGSEVGNYESFPFHTPLIDTDSVTFTLDSRQVDAIKFMVAHGELMVGTDSSEWRITPGNVSNTITPTSIDAKPKSEVGGASIKPLIAGNAVLFMNRTANKVYAVSYSVDSDSFKPVDLTVLAPHLFDGYTITEWAYQKTPDSVVWMIRSDGKALALSWLEEQEIWAWSIHDTDGTFQSVAVVPESGVDTAYFIVNRDVGGFNIPYVEQMMPRITDEDIFDWYFVDSGFSRNVPITISGASATNPVVIDATGHGLSDGDQVKIDDVGGMTELNGNYYLVSNKNPNDFELTNLGGININGSAFTAYTSGGAVRLCLAESTATCLHLLGEAVTVFGDGSRHTDRVVSGAGTVEINPKSAVFFIGTSYTSDLKTMPHETIGVDGNPTQGKYKTHGILSTYFHKTRAASVGEDENNLTAISFKDNGSGDAPAPLFTGVKTEQIEGTPKKLVNTFIRNTEPVPIEVVGYVAEVDFSLDSLGETDDN